MKWNQGGVAPSQLLLWDWVTVLQFYEVENGLQIIFLNDHLASITVSMTDM